MKLRERRNKLLRKRLQNGDPVRYRSSGWSLHPRVHSGQECYYVPVTKPKEVEVQDIVFCQVMPSRKYFAHVVKRKDCQWVHESDSKQGEETWFYIANMGGHVNGYCTMKTIYGKLIRVKD